MLDPEACAEEISRIEQELTSLGIPSISSGPTRKSARLAYDSEVATQVEEELFALDAERTNGYGFVNSLNQTQVLQEMLRMKKGYLLREIPLTQWYHTFHIFLIPSPTCDVLY